MKQSTINQSHQRGAATILISLILMFSITLLTLAVAKTQRTELIISANQEWDIRLKVASENANAEAHTHLTNGTLNWTITDSKIESALITTPSHDESIETTTSLNRPVSRTGPIYVESQSIRNDGSNQSTLITQQLLALSALSPKAEQAPPLIVNGCLLDLKGDIEIEPMILDKNNDQPSIWTNSTNCLPPNWIDAKIGTISENLFSDDLWDDLFSITREHFAQLASEDLHAPEPERIYWYANKNDITANQWTKNLGNPNHYILLYIPPDLGCPQFSNGNRIYGFIFIDSSCNHSTRTFKLDLIGNLAFNGDFGGKDLHLQIKQAAMILPILRIVTIPGSWKDFE